MSRESSRRYGAVNFEKAQYEQLAQSSTQDTRFREGCLFQDLIEVALKDAKLQPEDDYSLRLVVMENLPEDKFPL